jgi:uncharacterized protein YoaH (UPF0181 family)
VTQIPEDREAALQEDQSGVDRWLTRNEVRAKRNLPPIDGGDTLYLAFNQVELGENTPAKEETKSFGSIKIKTHTHNHEHKAVARKDAADEKFFRQLDKIEEKSRVKYKKVFNALLDDQEQAIIDKLDAYASKAYEELTPNEKEEAEKFTTEVILPLILALESAGTLAIDAYGTVDIAFVVDQATREAIIRSTDRLMRNFTRETALKIQKQIAMGVANGESKELLANRVRAVYKDAKGYRATRIAKSEVHKATNQGVAEGYRQSGFKKMRWRSRNGACEFCAAMDGTEIAIGQSFVPKGGVIVGTDGGEYLNDYDDIKYADAHPECDCYLEPVA